MSKISLGLVAGVLMGAVLAFAAEESITLTTYYPSPRGVYDELRARRYVSFDHPDKYVMDMQSGEVRMASLSLIDAATGRKYTLRVDDQRLVIAEAESGKAFILADLHQLQ